MPVYGLRKGFRHHDVDDRIPFGDCKISVMNTTELTALQKRINALAICSYVVGVLNVLLIAMPLWHYYKIGFRVAIDMYFVWVTALNILGFYLAYLVSNKLVYFRKKHSHFSEKLSGRSVYEQV